MHSFMMEQAYLLLLQKGFRQGSDGIFDDSLSNNKLNCVKNLLEISHTRGLEDL